MKTFHTTRRVAHPAKDMYALVADVERYPEFLPLCKALNLRSRETIDGKDVLTADMTVAYKIFSETFASRVTLDPDGLQILVEYIDGPFNHMENRWEFRNSGAGASDVDFRIVYEFMAGPLGLMMGTVIDQAFGKFAEAFEERADMIYRKSDDTAQTGISNA
jgi:coenzyme Q-binding protein COQ10